MRPRGVDLGPWLNNVGMTADAQRDRGDFDGYGRSFAFEDLQCGPEVTTEPRCAATGSGVADNVACDGQRIVVASLVETSRVVVVGAAESGSFREPLQLVAPDSDVTSVMLGLTDWLVQEPKFGERPYLTGSHVHEPWGDLTGPVPHLWVTTLVVPSPTRTAAILLPANPSVHVFAIVLLPPDPRSG